MLSRSFLPVLPVLACLQSFATAINGKPPEPCCFKFQTSRIPIKVTDSYKETGYHCTKAGIMYISNTLHHTLLQLL
ncbi:hypothetical protein QTP70_026922 [Hemibagrus guttatus]|uniref:Chemokine interleukin-8-like domain-containing protein n=1 Tax=Hemibagrus guttatus TaxID=175788 RepID=A0AAE0R9A5_9TELE|nr:hypothetical protein QTP70_026922 [Hemibagrus guttatus]KAK3567964.1 hypothetical protein QTP86_027388 [Hemibagrus guttatus]